METETEVVKSNGSYFTIGISVVSSLAAGFIIGYLIGKKNNTSEIQYEEKETLVDPNQLSIFDIVEEIELTSEEPDTYYEEDISEVTIVEEEKEESTVRVIRSGDDSWDYEAEVAGRTSTQPYIIHQDEFINAEMEFHQETVTYYVADDILADPNDTPIYNYSAMMGELKFGHGSNDPNVVYIRNEKFNMEWEVLRHEGSFAYEILGQQLEVEDEGYSVQKFRHE